MYVWAEMIGDKENAKILGNVMLFSPPKKGNTGGTGKVGLGGIRGPKESVPSLTCAKFSGAIDINFDKVDVGSMNSRKFSLFNPDQEKTVKIEVDKALESKGFGVSFGDDDGNTTLTLPASGKGKGVVTWAPKSDMTVSKKLTLKLNGEPRLQIKVNGIAGTGNVSTLYVYGLQEA